MTLLTEGTEDGQIQRQAAEQRLPGAGSSPRQGRLGSERFAAFLGRTETPALEPQVRSGHLPCRQAPQVTLKLTRGALESGRRGSGN